ncbi:MAG: MGMT family protein [Oligoflexia bacterium]|nr:MGMT family protein [Oligoflexia bacterium]
MLTDFTKQVIKMIKKIPKGKVATYGQIAKLSGKPHGARGVSWILHSCSKSHNLPWHRVINSKGKISFHWSTPDFLRQKRILYKEGIKFLTEDQIDLVKYQWRTSK